MCLFFFVCIGFVIDLMSKDLQLALDAARSVDAQTPLGGEAAKLYEGLAEEGFGNKDFSFIYQHIKGTAKSDDGKYGA